ncbi:hypothetical protein CASFOL_031920 [Castilleja foliolosa]|uniref:Uncharacterized protein n=1 Tax=Castilleja foliolosa TaxID=1961234 RepID=A0ABD3C0X7_9LAMI
MEGDKQSGSSFTSPPSRSSGYFGSIFAPPPRVGGSLNLLETEKKEKNDNKGQAWSGKSMVSGSFSDNMNDQRGQGQIWNTTTSKDKSSYNLHQQDEKVHPFHYSSSIYYGGQDVYSQPQAAHNPTFCKDVEEDDSGSASRGNWWKGSLYY